MEDSPLFKRKHKPKIDVVTVGTTSATIETLLGAALQDWCKVVTFLPHTTGIWMNDGVAVQSSSNDWPMLLASLELIGGPHTLDELQFHAGSPLKMAIMQEG